MIEAGVPLKIENSHIWERDRHDFYIEPEWVSARLFEAEEFPPGIVWDPACGSGRIVCTARAAGLMADGTDLVDRGRGFRFGHDFLAPAPSVSGAAAIVTNPPFKHAKDFVIKALSLVDKSCFLLPVTWLNGDRRSRWLEKQPLARVWVLTPRPSMPPGDVVLSGAKVGQGKQDFAWFVFEKGHDGQPSVGWLRR